MVVMAFHDRVDLQQFPLASRVRKGTPPRRRPLHG
jgi:hypothetical protein